MDEKNYIKGISVIIKGIHLFSGPTEPDVRISKHERNENLAIVDIPQNSDNFWKLLDLGGSIAQTSDGYYSIIVDIADITQVVR